MKKIFFVLILSLMQITLASPTLPAFAEDNELQGTISISGAWALYPMVIRWAEEFQKIYPEVRIDIAAGGAGKGMADCLSRSVDIGMVSRDIYPAEIEKGAWWVSVTKDAVIPTINDQNPVLSDLLKQGVTKEDFIGIWITNKIKTWGDLVDRDIKTFINVYTRSDACGAAKTWAKYLGKTQEDLFGVGVYGDPGVAQAVSKDILGIGFNNINFAYDPKSKKHIPGIFVLPIDINANGVLDDDENFYSNRDQIVEAIKSGKYPSPPARDLHFVSQGKPEKEVVREFLKWILTDGQKYVYESGYINLSTSKLKDEINKLDNKH